LKLDRAKRARVQLMWSPANQGRSLKTKWAGLSSAFFYAQKNSDLGGMGGGMGGYAETGVLPVTVLTIRVKKEDVDAFSKGDIDFEQFLRKVQILMY